MHLDTFIQTDFQVGKVPLDGPFGNRTQDSLAGVRPTSGSMMLSTF